MSGITLNTAYYQEAKASGLSDRDIAGRLEEHGLFVSNIDPLFNWLPGAVALEGDDAISICTRASAEDVFHLAHVVGTDLVNAPIGLATPESEQEIVDCFGALCELARAEDLRVSLEFMPFNKVSDLETATRIVRQAGCSNGGIMFDCWHHHRGGGVPDDILAVPGEYFFAMQMDDALPEPMEDVLEETLNHRLLPGEGCIDLVNTLRNLDSVGANLVYDVEVFNEALRQRGDLERSSRLFQSAHGILAGL